LTTQAPPLRQSRDQTWFKTFRLIKKNQEKRQLGKLVPPREIRNRCLPNTWRSQN
jgi:hypothetical protein